MTNFKTTGSTEPTAFVTKSRQRVKQYDNNIVYLKNGDEFEIELFNPTSNKVLAKIELNGNFLGSGIVLRPGERVFLERYLDEAKKFLFETYEVDKSDPNVREAIRYNGDVKVEFFNENKPLPIIHDYHYPIYHYRLPYDPYPYVSPFFSKGSKGIGSSTSAGSISGSVSYDVQSFCSNATNINFSNDFVSSMETGRVEKGSNSQQNFDYDTTSFNSYYTWKSSWKILPESQKAFVKEDLKVFCPNCGTRRKKDSHKFCPSCGQKFN
jgi:hypothetical protein